MSFNEEQVVRYARHIILPGIGGGGQQKLLDASVLCIGAGGLGSPVSMYLAAAGVGKLGIVDFDRVDLTNLQRQIAHGTSDVAINIGEGHSRGIELCTGNPRAESNIFEMPVAQVSIEDVWTVQPAEVQIAKSIAVHVTCCDTGTI